MTDEIAQCYQILELEPGTSSDAVKQAYRELVKIWHPDRFPEDPKRIMRRFPVSGPALPAGRTLAANQTRADRLPQAVPHSQQPCNGVRSILAKAQALSRFFPGDPLRAGRRGRSMQVGALNRLGTSLQTNRSTEFQVENEPS